MNLEEVSEFESLQSQLHSLHSEIGTLSKKKPDDAINEFKLRLVNQVIKKSNNILGDKNRPYEDFTQFDVEVIPTNSDVVLILSQYLYSLEKVRADNVESYMGNWYWVIEGERSKTKTAPPHKLKY